MSTKREVLIQTAIRLFSKYGYHATGVDMIVREAGVTKKTLYNHFDSKKDLIVAALRQHDEAFRKDFIRSVEANSKSPYLRMLAIFDVADNWFQQHDFFGCMFIQAVGEFPEEDYQIREVCKNYKTKLTGYIIDLAEQAQVTAPRQLALQLALLLEGAIVTAQVSNTTDSAQQAKNIARILIDQQRTPASDSN